MLYTFRLHYLCHHGVAKAAYGTTGSRFCFYGCCFYTWVVSKRLFGNRVLVINFRTHSAPDTAAVAPALTPRTVTGGFWLVGHKELLT